MHLGTTISITALAYTKGRRRRRPESVGESGNFAEMQGEIKSEQATYRKELLHYEQ